MWKATIGDRQGSNLSKSKVISREGIGSIMPKDLATPSFVKGKFEEPPRRTWHSEIRLNHLQYYNIVGLAHGYYESYIVEVLGCKEWVPLDEGSTNVH